MGIIIEAKSVRKEYGKSISILNNINLKFYDSEFVAIIGHSGSGKTTLLNILSSISKPTSGEVNYKGQDLTKISKGELSKIRRDDIGLVFQNYLLLSNLTVKENMLIGIGRKKDYIDYKELSRFLGIENLLNKFPYELSGGEQQRVAIARAVIKKPTVIFCDEATGALDEQNSKNIVEFLQEIKKKYAISVIFSTHNKKISYTADRVLVLRDGEIIEEIKNSEPLSPYEISWEI